MPAPLDILGRNFARLTVLSRSGVTISGQVLWKCRCLCGNLTITRGSTLMNSHTRSCGCLQRERAGRYIKHGHTSNGRCTPEYVSWAAMHQRCRDSDHPAYKDYGGRGIKICKRWTGKHGFEHFFSDMGKRPSLQLSLDRFPDNDGDYKPGNCRWANPKEQSLNRRKRLGPFKCRGREREYHREYMRKWRASRRENATHKGQ